MWVEDKEWCGMPLVVTEYRGSFNPPAIYSYGALYGIHIPDGMPEYESMWICTEHRLDFLKLNSGGGHDTTIWQMNHYGMGDDVTWIPTYEVSVRIRANIDHDELSGLIENNLNDLISYDERVKSWTYLKVVTT